jgi:hypothetical protein
MNAEATYSSSFAGGTCLSTGELRHYLDGTLPRQNLHLVEKHLVDCEFCSHILEDLDVSENAVSVTSRIEANVNSRISELIGPFPQAGIWATYGNYIKAGSLILLLLGGVLVYRFADPSAPKTVSSTISPATPAPVAPTPSSIPVTKAPVADEFPIHRPDAPATTPADDKSVNASSTAGKSEETPNTEVAEPSPKNENNLSTPEAVLVPVPKKEESPAEIAAEKENVTNLQIVAVKVLQKMTKTSGGSRKGSRKGQLSAPSDKNSSFYLMEDMPAFPGGDEAMEEYLANNFKNPVKDKRTLTGKAIGVMFTVGSRGRISDVEITHSISPDLDAEIIRLISSMPIWIPGKHLVGDITCVLALTVK